MLHSDFWVLLAMLIYFVVVLTIGFIYAKKSNQSTSNYFLGGRQLGPWLTALSAEASDMSGWLLMGLPGVAYFTGASDAMWTAIGLAIGTYVNWKIVAKRLRIYSEKAGDSITLPQYFANRFHDDRHIISTVAAIIIFLFFSIYVGSCFVTCGKLFSTLFGFDYATMMMLGAIIVFLYTFVGGYLSVCTTDLIQGTLMFFALAIVFIGSVANAGGVDNVVNVLRSIPGFLKSKLFLGIVIMVAASFILETVGFIVTALFVLFFYGLLLGEKNVVRLLIAAVCITLVLYIVFSGMLSVNLPRGTIGFLRNFALWLESVVGAVKNIF